jgi:capsular exopolysaccharide synthesis family protein
MLSPNPDPVSTPALALAKTSGNGSGPTPVPAHGRPTAVAGLAVALPPALASDPMDGALLRALRRCWLPAVGFGLLGAVLTGAIAWFVLPSKYTAQALLHVASHLPPGVFTGSESSDDFAAYQRTQATLLKSRTVLQAALRLPQVAELEEVRSQTDPASWLGSSLVVDSTLGPEILRVSLSGEHPQALPVLVNGVVQAYLQEVVNADQIKQQARVEQLMENYRRFEDTLRRKRSTLRELETSLGVEDPQTVALRYQSALQQLSVAQKERLQAHLGLKNTQAELAAERDRFTKPPQVVVSELAIDQYLKQDPAYQQLLIRQAQLEQDMERIQRIAVPGIRESQMEGPRTELARLQQTMRAHRKEIRPLVEAQLKIQTQEETKAAIAKLETRVAVFQVQEQGLAGEVQRLEGEIKRLAAAIRQPDKPTSDLEALRDEVTQGEQVLKKLTEQLYTLKVEPVMPPRVRLLEAAEVPQSKTLDRKIKTTGLATLGMFSLVVLGISWREYRARRVYEVADVAQGLGLNLLGTLPALPTSARRLLPGTNPGNQLYWQTLLAESVDALRTQLLHAAQLEPLRVIMITSASGGEGKTSLASHLATSLARARRRVLLVDGDLRNPGVQRQFGCPLEPGLSEVLRGENSFADVVQATPQERLAVVPAGRWDSEAIQALAQKGSGSIFDSLKDEYDFIVVDSSPVLPVADSLLLGQHADGVVFAILREESRLPAIYAAHQRLATLGIRLLGTVVIGVNGDGPARLYPYGRAAQ